MSPFVIGVDGGGTKTEAIVMDEAGRILGHSRGGPANHYQVGWSAAFAEIETAVSQAARSAGVQANEAAAIALALGGVDRPGERAMVERLARSLWPRPALRVENDALAALVGGVGTAYGIVLIAGTGMIAYGVNEEGTHARAGGWGYRADESGSAYTLGLDAVRAVLASHDGVGLTTCLEETLLRALNLSHVQELIPWLYTADEHVERTAALAPHVLACAKRGDTVAVEIVARGADHLADVVWAVARRLNMDTRSIPVVLAGGVLVHSEFYRQAVTQAIRTRLPLAWVRLPQDTPAVGAARLAWETAGRSLPQWQPITTSERPTWTTEWPNVFTRNLDTRTAKEIVGLMHVEDTRAVRSMESALSAIATVVDALAERMARGGRLIYVGAGTPGRLGILDASECPPTFGVSPEVVTAVIAGGEKAIRFAIEGAEDDEEAGYEEVNRLHLTPMDTVVGISASGRTPYVRGALRAARGQGSMTVAIVCNMLSPMEEEADYVIRIPVGPEVIAGSTRLKAGTAQKLVLNMLSTATMVRLGKVYDNLMVDVQPTNHKLRERARRILQTVTQLSPQEAEQALEQSGWDVKVALVSTLIGCSPEEARQRLAKANGFVRHAVDIDGGKSSI